MDRQTYVKPEYGQTNICKIGIWTDKPGLN